LQGLDLSDPQLEDAWEELKRGGVDWLTGTYAPKSRNRIVFHEKGRGGFDELRSTMVDGIVLYAVLRITVDKLEKFIVLAWIGESAGLIGGYVSMHKQAVR
jgi:hypothetical protein